jgi:4'-phosphopantetheinyl transferase
VQILWLAQTEVEVPLGDAWLSPAEAGAAARLRVPKRHAEWRLGRWSVKCAMAAWLGPGGDIAEPAQIEVRPSASGAPRVWVRGRAAQVAVSLSHSHGVGFCALAEAGTLLGCDVEKVEPRSAAFIADYLTEAEQEMVRLSGEGSRDELVTLLWSAKESALKAVGEGLRGDPRSVEIRPGKRMNGCWEALRAVDGEGREFEGWWRSTGGLVWTLLAAPAPEALHGVVEGLEYRSAREVD